MGKTLLQFRVWLRRKTSRLQHKELREATANTSPDHLADRDPDPTRQDPTTKPPRHDPHAELSLPAYQSLRGGTGPAGCIAAITAAVCTTALAVPTAAIPTVTIEVADLITAIACHVLLEPSFATGLPVGIAHGAWGMAEDGLESSRPVAIPAITGDMDLDMGANKHLLRGLTNSALTRIRHILEAAPAPAVGAIVAALVTAVNHVASALLASPEESRWSIASIYSCHAKSVAREAAKCITAVRLLESKAPLAV